jgi:serine phosphatase RsbU (regulator of sigma subunit)
MSDHGFHVHGPHDHALEHAAHGEPDSFSGRLAVITAILATVGAIFSYLGGATQSNAGLLKNDAAIRKTEAANQWAYYQSKSNKQNLSELAVEIVPEARKPVYQDEAKRYKAEKAEIQAKAERLEAEAIVFDDKSNQQIHEHHRWAQATTVLQISIAMAAIALLTQRKWLVWGVLGLGAIGIAIGALAWMQV